MLQKLNYYALPDENLNTIAIATCALITIFAIHDTLERLIISGNGELSSQTIAGFVLLRSQASLSTMISILRRDPMDNRGNYHPPNCSCAGGGCVFPRNRSPMLVRVLVKTSVLRVLILFFEVLFLCMAFTMRKEVKLMEGRFALTIHENDFGTHLTKKKVIDPEIGCYNLFTDNHGRPESLNRITQAMYCIVKLRPTSLPNKSGVSAAEEPPLGFSTFVFDLDVTGDDAGISDVDKKYTGAEMYASWSVKGKIAEGPIPVVGWGKEYSPDRSANMSSTELITWRKALDSQLQVLLGGAYRTAYGNNRTWHSQDGEDIVRMVMYIDMTALPSRYVNKTDATMIYLLNDLVGIQKSNESSSTLFYSDGASIEKEKDVVKYILTGPILGLIPWVLLRTTTVLCRALYSRWRPDKFLGLIFAMFKRIANIPIETPLRGIPPGKLIFNEDGIFFEPYTTDDSIDQSQARDDVYPSD